MNRLIILALCLIYPLSADSQILRGRITDTLGKPLEGVTIQLIRSGIHVHSGASGQFVLEGANAADTLQFTLLGYGPAVLTAGEVMEKYTIILVEKTFDLAEVVISPGIDPAHVIAEIDLQVSPVNSSQELLRKVPGLIIGQHAGGGKAEQMFLRGFDLDHGTDILISVDGMPVNMVSHAHGQGYADLHFLIPETLERIVYGKGPYNPEQGNFTTAGYVNFSTKDRLDQNLMKIEAGQFNTRRLLGMFNLLSTAQQNVYVAAEFLGTDGPFDSPQHFTRYNLMARYTGTLPNEDEISFSVSVFGSQWDASGQIPERAVGDGTISRFGAIDDTEGGTTGRVNVNLAHRKSLGPNTLLRNRIFVSRYDFDLFSNFTFFLRDPEFGDQIRQRESRWLTGLQSEVIHAARWLGGESLLTAGLQLRSDAVDNNQLTYTYGRYTPLDTIQLGDVQETNLGGYAGLRQAWGAWVVTAGLRMDALTFVYRNAVGTYDAADASRAIVMPKLTITYQPVPAWQLYIKAGRGFHSNDTRVVLDQTGRDILPAAYGADLGVYWKPMPSMLFNVATWGLLLDQEFVYVGDEGIVEPGGRTRRHGIDLSMRYQPLRWLYADADMTWSTARATDEADGKDFIPLAPIWTFTGGIGVLHPSGLTCGLRWRYLSDRPANEDNSIIAHGYTVFDFNIGYTRSRWGIELSVQNVFNTEWNEAQFATTSRLKEEPAPVEEIHFTPGTPFMVKAGAAYRF